MADNPKITEELQKSDAGILVTMYEIDLLRFGGTILRFTSGSDGAGNTIAFNSNSYPPLPITIDGFEAASNTAFPRPRMKVSNILNAVSSVMANFNDLLGAEVTRIRTFSQFLDGFPEADPAAKFPDDIFIIDRKVLQNNLIVEWELASILDQEGAKIPNRVIHKNGCPLIYRRFDTSFPGNFDTTRATCPYGGSAAFDANDNATTQDKDVCAKRLSSCKLRFPSPEIVPLESFPGVGRTR